ncbi:Hypothetical_protein [Hexamita inflata]|uniref:Hypothetical_protein n=1 Tax=Hexamita inflata TaxID=28002 RepID=A0AA86TMP4_9EUKA|nr:Hypothetical protein HINF_LOCUS10874 [Hexamita inflata]
MNGDNTSFNALFLSLLMWLNKSITQPVILHPCDVEVYRITSKQMRYQSVLVQSSQLDDKQIKIIPEPELATKLELVQSQQNQQQITKYEPDKPQIQNKPNQTIENCIRSEFLLKFEKTQTALSILNLIFTLSQQPSPQSQIQIQIVLKNLFDLTPDDLNPALPPHAYNLKNDFLFNFIQTHHFKEGKVEVPFKNESEKQFFKEFAEILKFKFNNKFVFGFKKIQ